VAVYIVTGKLGNGKTLISVSRIKEKLQAGCKVATNLDIKLNKMLSVQDKTARLLRIPDKPSSDDLYNLGTGNTTYDETKNGLLVLDECGTWFNSRNWQDKTRKALNDWFLHSRKLGWDVILIVQDVSILDSQSRSAIAEHTCFCRRLDRLHIPFFGSLLKILTLGEPVRLPRVHVGKVVYGTSEQDPLTDRWIYRGTDLFAAYDTKQTFLDDYSQGTYSALPGYYTHGRYAVNRDWRFFLRMTKISWKRFKSPFSMFAGILLGALIAVYAGSKFSAKPDAAVELPVVAADSVISAPVVAESHFKSSALDTLKIAGIIRQPEINKNLFIFKSVGITNKLITSTELIQMSIAVKYISDCHAILTYQKESVDIYCV